MYREHDYPYHPELSRREVLEHTFHVDDRHPLRRVLFEVVLAFLPLAAVAASIGVFCLVGHA